MSSTSAAQDAPAKSSAPDLMPVPITTLMASTSLSVDLYIKAAEDQPPVLYRERKFEVEPGDFEKLTARGIRVVYVPSGQLDAFQQQLRENLGTFMENDGVPTTARYEYLSEAARAMLSEAFDNGHTDVVVQVASELGDQMVAMVSSHDMVANDLFGILRHDYQTFTHSFNVSSFGVLLAKALSITDEAELKEIAVGGLIHDLGKLSVPPAILNKNGRLNDEERKIIEMHPTNGFVQLCERDDMSWAQLMMVYQHHEKLDGSGYPVGLVGDEIHYLGRLCTVVDIFEAMTSNRPYRKSIPIPDVLEYEQQLAGGGLDREMVQCWTETMARRQ